MLSLFQENESTIWVGTASGIQRFDPRKENLLELPEVFKSNASFLSAKIWKVTKDADGDLWFASETKGVFRYNSRDNKLLQYNHLSGENGLASDWVNDIMVVDENTLWFATKNGLSVYKKDENSFSNYKHDLLKNYSISDNSLMRFMKDHNGSIWIGTFAGGINLFNPANSNFINISETIKPNFGLNNSMVYSIAEGENSTLWVGTYGGGLNHLDFLNQESSTFLIKDVKGENINNIITSLANDGNEKLWVGSLNGLFQFSKKNHSFNKVELEKDSNNRPVTSIILDEDGTWIGTDGAGLKHIEPNGKVHSYINNDSLNSLSDDYITDLTFDNDGIWIATQNGLNFFNKEKGKITRLYKMEGPNSISNNNLTSLYKDGKERLWVGTDYNGLNYFDKNEQKFYVIDKCNGFTNQSIRGIAEDEQNNLWISADDGLYRIKFLKFEPPFHTSDLEITAYGRKDGLSVKQFSNNASQKLDGGELIFGGSGGLAIFNPESITKKNIENKILLTKLLINNKEVPVGTEDSPLSKAISESSEIVLNYDQGYIGLEFSALNFINPGSNKYAYRLDASGFDDDWHEIGTQNRVNFTGLEPGDYTFKLRTLNDDGTWSEATKDLDIRIRPPFWFSWWAYLIYLVTAVVIVLALIRFFRNRIRLKKALFLELVEKNRQKEVHQMKLDFFTNISHELRTPLTLISGPLEDLMSNGKDDAKTHGKLQLIKNNSDRLLKLINELMDFRKAEKGQLKIYCTKENIIPFCFNIFESFKGMAERKNIDFRFIINTDSLKVYFDKDQLEKVIFNVLSNAFKFTGENGSINLIIEKRTDNGKWVDILIKDNGIGIPENNKKEIFENFFQVNDGKSQHIGSGVGLAFSKNIMELHQGEIKVEDQKGIDSNGTTFKISLRKGKKHLKNSQIIKSKDLIGETKSIHEKREIKIPVKIESEALDIPSSENELSTLWIIEDNIEIRSFLADSLSGEYQIKEFSNGLDALGAMENEIPDLVISDVMMPEMDGFELCEKIKTREATNHIPVILLTAKASVHNQVEGLSIGADAYISKPFSLKVLKLNIINILSSREILRQKYSGSFILDTNVENLTTPEEKFIKKLMSLIEKNLEDPDFDVNELVNQIGMSRTVLYKKVQSLTNYSVANLIKSVRLKKAAEIFKNTSFPVSEVAYMVGFNNRKHFSKEFKKVYNASPSEYKRGFEIHQ